MLQTLRRIGGEPGALPTVLEGSGVLSGVLNDIDIQKAMKEKLGKDIAPHRILGACNPPLAYKALQVEADIGLPLPCVTVRQGFGDDIIVGFLNPDMMVQLSEIAPEPAQANVDAHNSGGRFRKQVICIKWGWRLRRHA